MTRSITCRTWRQANDIAVALVAAGHDAYPMSDSKGRPTLMTDASDMALDAAVATARTDHPVTAVYSGCLGAGFRAAVSR